MKTEILQRNPYHGIRAAAHQPLPNPTLEELRDRYDGLLRAEYWIPRTQEDEAAIQLYKQELLASGKTIEDEIRELAGESGFVFMENRFPYAIQNACHYVLWVLDDNSLEEADQYLRMFLETNQIRPDDMVCYENNIAYQTASGIPHFHVYIPER